MLELWDSLPLYPSFKDLAIEDFHPLVEISKGQRKTSKRLNVARLLEETEDVSESEV